MPDIVAKDIHAKEIELGGGAASGDVIRILSATGLTTGALSNNTSAGGQLKLNTTGGSNRIILNYAAAGDGSSVFGASSMNSYAVVQIDSTTKALVIPRLTTAQVTTLSGNLINSMSGALVFNTDTGKLMVMDKTGFVAVH